MWLFWWLKILVSSHMIEIYTDYYGWYEVTYWPVLREVEEWRWSDEQIQIMIGVAVAMPRISLRQSIKWPVTAGTWTRQQSPGRFGLSLRLFKGSVSTSKTLLLQCILGYIRRQGLTSQSSQLKFISLCYLKQTPSPKLVVLSNCKSLRISEPSKTLFKRLPNQIMFSIWSLRRNIFHDSDTNTTLLWLLLSVPKRPPMLIKLQTSPLPKLRWVGTISIQ